MFNFRSYFASKSIPALWGIVLVTSLIALAVGAFATMKTGVYGAAVFLPVLLVLPIYLFLIRLSFEALHATFRTARDVQALREDVQRLLAARTPSQEDYNTVRGPREPDPAPHVPAFLLDSSAPPATVAELAPAFPSPYGTPHVAPLTGSPAGGQGAPGVPGGAETQAGAPWSPPTDAQHAPPAPPAAPQPPAPFSW